MPESGDLAVQLSQLTELDLGDLTVTDVSVGSAYFAGLEEGCTGGSSTTCSEEIWC